MKLALVAFLGTTLAVGCAADAGSADDGGGDAKVTIAEKTFAVSNVRLTYEIGDDGYFRVEGQDAAHPDQDCLPALGGGLALYGDWPSGAASLADLAGKEVPFEFTGDGDDFNLCFVGSNGLLGVEQGTVRFTSVEGTRVAFSFSGSFLIYDYENGREPVATNASGSGLAHAVAN